MSNELIKIEGLELNKFTGDDLKAVASTGTWLSRLMLMGPNSGLVAEKKIEAGHYALIQDKNSFKDLGDQVDLIPITWRPLAMDINGDEVISIYNKDSEAFKRIEKESEKSDSGCMFGPQFLIYIKEHGFSTFYCSSKTFRREAPKIHSLLLKGTTLTSQFIKKKRYSWYGPVVSSCSTPFDLPDQEELKKQVHSFNNPEEEEREVSEQPTRER